MNGFSFAKIIGWSFVGAFSSLFVSMLLYPYLNVSFNVVFITSFISFMVSYLLILARMYNYKIFYFSLFSLFVLGLINLIITKYSFTLPDPKTYAAAYIVFGTLLGIGISIAFLYLFYEEDRQET